MKDHKKVPVHDHGGYIVPLLWTFSFPHHEWWCPYCGNNYPMFSSNRKVEETPALKEQAKQYRKLTRNYLAAVGMIKGRARRE